MERNFKWRFLITLAVLIWALVYLFPSAIPSLPTWWQKFMPSEKVHLGLDLRGGIHLVLEVRTEAAIASQMDRTVDELKYSLRKVNVPVSFIDRTQTDGIKIELVKEDNLEKLNKLLDDEFGYLITQKTTREENQVQVFLTLDDKEAARIKDMALKQALETIRNRIDQFGVTEPDIRPQGETRIVIQLPGVDDTKRAVELIRQTARLEFKLVDETHDLQQALDEGPPPGTEILYEVTVDPDTGREKRTPYLLEKRILLTGEYITDARQVFDQYNAAYVTLNFDAKGARIFERVTGDNIKRSLAIILDNKVKSAPVIQDKIAGGRASITGIATREEAQDLAVVLRSGALPAPVDILEERTVGPSLGQDSINQGLMSILIGGVFILAFMPIYYRLSGVIADLALLFNMLLIMAVLITFKASLTLPGIAGIILTIGMSVDANVLIFERIREEIRLGKTPRAAVDGGFSKAMWTILDANITTLIAAIVLYQFGTGPVRGFAVTLSIGIVASLFTAMFVSRLIFDYLLTGVKMKAISV